MTQPWRTIPCTGPGGRGCPCDRHQQQKVYAREYAKRRREARLETANRESGRICQKRFGQGKCGGILETRAIGGQTETTCPFCERQRRRICRDCPRPVEGGNRAIRCAECKEIARAEQVRKSCDRNRRRINARARASYADPEVRRRRNEYKKAYRRAHPEKVREWKRQYTLKHSREEGSAYVEYHRRYNAQTKRAQAKRKQARESYYRDNPVRPDPKCQHCGDAITWWKPKPGGHAGAPPKNCDRCCDKYELARRLKTRAEASALAAAGVPLDFVALPIGHKAIRIKNAMPARYAPTGERLCSTVDCETVMTHRRKKCSRCRAKEVELARQQLEAHHGRGRRTDLGAGTPTRKSGPKPKPVIIAPPRSEPAPRSAPRGIDVEQWTERLGRGLTTWQMAEELSLDESAVRSRLRLAGGDLLARAYANNARAEKTKRSLAAASTWAKPRDVAGAA